MIMRLYALLWLLCWNALAASAEEWLPLGPRAMAMGGAGVALPQGPISSYWNPAQLGLPENPSGVAAVAGAHVDIVGSMAQGSNDFQEIASDCQSGGAGFGNCTKTKINQSLATFAEPGSGFLIDAGAGIGLKLAKASLFVNEFVYDSGEPRADFANISPAALAAGRNGLPGGNQSAVIVRGIVLTEIGAGYGAELPFARGVFVGGNIKALVGRVAYREYPIDYTNWPNYEDLTSGSKKSVQPGLDAGILWDVHRTLPQAPLQPRLGITARDINDPKFAQPDQAVLAGEPARYSLYGQYRAGLSITPLPRWQVAADADIVPNQVGVDGLLSQTICVGTEVVAIDEHWIQVPLRIGAYRNVAQQGNKTIFTGGFGLRVWRVALDVAGSISPSREDIQTNGSAYFIPEEFGVSSQLSFFFAPKS